MLTAENSNTATSKGESQVFPIPKDTQRYSVHITPVVSFYVHNKTMPYMLLGRNMLLSQHLYYGAIFMLVKIPTI